MPNGKIVDDWEKRILCSNPMKASKEASKKAAKVSSTKQDEAANEAASKQDEAADEAASKQGGISRSMKTTQTILLDT